MVNLSGIQGIIFIQFNVKVFCVKVINHDQVHAAWSSCGISDVMAFIIELLDQFVVDHIDKQRSRTVQTLPIKIILIYLFSQPKCSWHNYVIVTLVCMFLCWEIEEQNMFILLVLFFSARESSGSFCNKELYF